MSTPFDYLSSDLTSLILSRLPLQSLLRCSAVSRGFRLAALSSVHHPRTRPPWFFLFGLNSVVSRLDQAFGFDPEAFRWVALPSPHTDCIGGAEGFVFETGSSGFGYSKLLEGGANPEWRFTKPMSYNRYNPIVAVFEGERFVVVGGARYIGGLVDLEDRLTVEIYEPSSDSWEVGPPLPVDFRSGGSSSQWLSAALLQGRKTLFVFGIYSCHIAAFDLSKRVWKGVKTLRPHGALFAFLLAGPADCLLLAGLCAAEQADTSNPNPSGVAQPCFTIWSVDPDSLTHPKPLTKMPPHILTNLFGSSDEDENRFASLKCVGTGRLVYVFNADHHKGYPTCVCEIGEGEMGVCKWAVVPQIPGMVNRFHKTVAFCSSVMLEPVLGRVE